MYFLIHAAAQRESKNSIRPRGQIELLHAASSRMKKVLSQGAEYAPVNGEVAVRFADAGSPVRASPYQLV